MTSPRLSGQAPFYHQWLRRNGLSSHCPHINFRPSSSGRPPTRPTRPRRRAPPRIDRTVSVLPEGRDVQHARVRGKEPHDIENSLLRLSNSAIARMLFPPANSRLLRAKIALFYYKKENGRLKSRSNQKQPLRSNQMQPLVVLEPTGSQVRRCGTE